MLVEIAIGDAYGAGMEYVKTAYLLANNTLKDYCKHPTHGLKPGQYTDDTQMSIAVAETLLASDDFNTLTKRDFTVKFVEAFQRDPRDGYSRAFQKFLYTVKDADDFLARIQPNSKKSGGAMRVGPVGLIPDIKQVDRIAALQASVTHDTDLGKDAARAIALSVHYCYYNLGPKNKLAEFLHEQVPGYKWSEPWSGKIKSIGIWHARAATTMIMEQDNLADILQSVVAYEGDVDTAAAMAMAIGSCSEEIKQNLPEILYWRLERTKYGTEYLESLDEKLLERF